MTQPPITPASGDQPVSDAGRPPCSGEVPALAEEIAGTGRPAGARESLGRRAGDFTAEGQVAELARLLADLRRGQDGQLDENERLDRQLGALGQDVETQRHAIADLENHLDDLITQQLDENERLDRQLGALGQDVTAQRHAVAELRDRLDDLTALAGERAERQPAGTGEQAIWWPDLPAGQERAAALRRLRAWVDDVLRARHPELASESLRPCWDRHEDVVDELTALRAAWQAAYRGAAAPATAAIEWHERWLPGCLARCKAALTARPCSTAGHPSPPGTEAPGGPAAAREPTGPEATASAGALRAGMRSRPGSTHPGRPA